jgi:small subunit ribosomal protein S5
MARNEQPQQNQPGDRDNNRGPRGRGRGRGDKRDGEGRGEDGAPEFIERLVGINRVAKTVKGGRRMAFAALVIVGDGKGRVGHGHGKAREVPEAIKKATEKAKRKMIRVPLREGRTLHHDVHGRYGAGRVFLRPAVPGTGIIAGGPMRAVFEALGIQDVVAKALGSSNPYSMVNATFAALEDMQSPRHVANRRNKKISDIVSGREAKQAVEGQAVEGEEEKKED